MRSLARWSTVLMLASCGTATAPAAPAGAAPRFSAPSLTGDCRADRLEVVEQEVDLGKPYKPWQWLALETSVSHHAHLAGDLLVLLVPVTDPRERVVALDARRFDISNGRWLASTPHPLGGPPALLPRFTELTSGLVGGDLIVRWTDPANRTFVRAYSITSATWREADPATQVPAYDGRATDAASPPNPEPSTGVTVQSSGEHRTVTLTAPGRSPATLQLPTRPGTYVGAFPATRTALLWNNQREDAQRQRPASDRFDSYLVSLDSGATCRIPRELAFRAAAMFRTKQAIVMLNILRTEPPPPRCPAGAPCVAPEPAHFRGVSVTTLRDRGP